MTAFAVSMMIAASPFSASEEGKMVALRKNVTTEYLRISNVIGHASLHKSLDNLAAECSTDGWDGYEAFAVEADSVYYAHLLLDSSGSPGNGVTVSIGAEPDGQTTVEWHKSPTWTLSVSVTSKGELHYAAMLGSSSAYGTEPFDAAVGLPDTIKRLIRRIEAA